MVILQFNKLIRNKWVWGAFAIVVSAAFCFDDLFRSSRDDERPSTAAGTLDGKEISTGEFGEYRQEVLGFGRMRDDTRSDSEINLETWKAIAADKAADEAGIAVSDATLERAIMSQFAYRGGFNYAEYKDTLARNFSITPERYERALRRIIARNQGLHSQLLASGAFVSPMELDVMVADATDKYTVRVARFRQDKEKADAITVDDAALKKWYDDNTKKLALPERIKIRYVRYDASNPELLAKMEVTEDDMRDMYDSTIDRYTSTDTNGVEVVKPFDEVKGDIEKELRLVAAVDCLVTNLQRRAYRDLAEGESPDASRVDSIAAEDGATVEESEWFSLEGKFVEGFMRRIEAIAPGAREFADRVAELDPTVRDLRYGVASSANAVWLFERSALSEAHTPDFEEAKPNIGSQALRDAKAEALKLEVEAIAAKGVDAVLATDNVSTNIAFSLYDIAPGAFRDQQTVARAATKLSAGEISPFLPTGVASGILVVCVDRQPGDAVAAMSVRDDLRSQAVMSIARDLATKWDNANLASMHLAANEGYETAEAPQDDTEEVAE